MDEMLSEMDIPEFSEESLLEGFPDVISVPVHFKSKKPKTFMHRPSYMGTLDLSRVAYKHLNRKRKIADTKLERMRQAYTALKDSCTTTHINLVETDDECVTQKVNKILRNVPKETKQIYENKCQRLLEDIEQTKTYRVSQMYRDCKDMADEHQYTTDMTTKNFDVKRAGTGMTAKNVGVFSNVKPPGTE